MITQTLLLRRIEALTAAFAISGIPIDGLAVTNSATTPPTVRVDYASAATTQQKATGASIVSGFDWSQAADDATRQQNSRVSAQSTLAAVDDATAVVLRGIVLVVVDQLNVIRAALPTPLPPITPAQAKAAIIAKITAGLADS